MADCDEYKSKFNVLSLFIVLSNTATAAEYTINERSLDK